MRSCVFCDIAKGQEVASRIFEDDDFMVIMDAYPLTEGHILIIPKQHVKRLHELPAPMQTRLFALGSRAMQALQSAGWGCEGINLLLNDGKAANQTVPHLHLHLIPRRQKDLLKSLPKLLLHVTGLFGLKTSRSTLDQHAERLKRYF